MKHLAGPRSLLIIALAVSAGVAAVARGQDANRVDFRLRENGAIDASNQVGSGGYNRGTIPNYVTDNANLYITGNVSFGRSFQAYSPVQDATAFSAGLGSSSLYTFRRDSVSVGDVLAGRNPTITTPYYSRQRTTTSLGTLSAGFDRVGTLGTDGIYAMPNRTSALTVRPYDTLYAQELSPTAPTVSVGIGQVTMPPAELSPFLQSLPRLPLPSARTMPWFGLNPVPPGLSGEHQAAPGEEVPLFDTVAFPEGIDLVSRRALEEQPPPPGGTVWQTGESGEPAGAEDAAGQVVLPWLDPQGGVATTDDQLLPSFSPTGADLYQDMAGAYAFASELAQQEAEVHSTVLTSPAKAEQYQRDLSVVREMLGRPIVTFAGSSDSQVQNLIREAEALVQHGRYYQAKALYQQAMIFDRDNPLLLLGQGHAMLAAGEYYSAALMLSRAIELFNAIAYFKFDLRTFITEPDLLEKRRADLEARLETREDYRLRFVLGYAEYYSDLAKYGLPNLKLAAEQAPEHSGVARLYGLLTRDHLLKAE